MHLLQATLVKTQCKYSLLLIRNGIEIDSFIKTHQNDFLKYVKELDITYSFPCIYMLGTFYSVLRQVERP